MKAVIMAGGLGTRLRPLTVHVPKPLVPVGNAAIMEHNVRLLRRHGYTDLVALLFFLPETIVQHFGDGSRWGVHITYVTPSLEMMGRLDVRLHQLTRAVPESHLVRAEVPCPDERKGAVMRRLIESTKAEQVDLIEGVRVRRGDEWVAAIPDADRPCFQVVAESTDGDRARRLADEFRERIGVWRREPA